MRPEQDPEEVYEQFWKDLVEVDGEVNLEQVKKELSDFKWAMDNVPIVYGEITGYATSNIRVIPSQIISLADESYEKNFRSDLEDALRHTPDSELRDGLIEAFSLDKERSAAL